MPNTIYLARHGQDEANAAGILNGHLDMPLTKLGRDQALKLSQSILSQKVKFDIILCSPLIRAHETAQIIASELGYPNPTFFPLIIERDFGIMTGKPITDILKLPREILIKNPVGVTFFLGVAGAETFPEVKLRAEKALNEISLQYQNKTVLLVCHGDIGRMLYAAYFKLDPIEVTKTFHIGNCELIELSKQVTPISAKIISAEQFNS